MKSEGAAPERFAIRRSSIRRSPALLKAIKGVGRILLSLKYRFHVEGREILPPEGPGIFLVKHQHWMDTPAVTLAIPRDLHFVAKKELFQFPPRARLMTLLGGIPLDREHPESHVDSFRYLRTLLHERQFIVIFPEGTYFPERMGPGKTRLVEHLLKFWKEESAAPLPFIPVGIRYRGRWPRRVEVRIGPALYARGPEEGVALMSRAMEAIARLTFFSQETARTLWTGGAMSLYAELFALAAKTGCFEGYLYERKQVDPGIYDDWVGNMTRMFAALPEEVRREIRPEFHQILTNALGSSREIAEIIPRSLEALEKLVKESAL
ncbi:MAG: 1-acyl-sn-glycerol-3-phosphate acyltransferase [Candidatus Tectomicrobia bacterium]|uniref:1-acyl-sn-glycerol-3-phosphate acyltransferase n=1 Tax=Tectimicrobiota bacterium TaxID=2528274 RepID=A0A932M0C3_UNCTE|nr:1-acyl-sn-glycerol-3-phosphate acyltransferase [Candidatus Tectomicrobia bacterium]